MNFMKYPTKNDISISNAVLKLAKLQNAERLELTNDLPSPLVLEVTSTTLASGPVSINCTLLRR